LLDGILQWSALAAVPSEHRVLHKSSLGVVKVESRVFQEAHLGRAVCLASCFAWDSFMHFSGDFDEFHVLGVPWELDEFLQKSPEVPHPMDKSAALLTELRFAVLQMAKLEVSEIVRRGVEFFQY